MIKIVILAYMMNTNPMATAEEFQMGKTFETMEACKRELTLQSRGIPQVYDVTWDFVVQGDFKWDWVIAACVDEQTGEKFKVFPAYDNGVPEGVEELLKATEEGYVPGIDA
ncbi:MAG: hypothetical protein CMN04_05315 [Roseibacillus sp.]|nr:hypothetical protein [Roseibacillus sp.]|tara:strand:- start:4905 stop:5237 length:333 start_codon:yes stop_codon:yes gene_type:complete